MVSGETRMMFDYKTLSAGTGPLIAKALMSICDGLSNSSGSERAKHIGVYCAVFTLTELGQPATVKSVANTLGMAQPHINTSLRTLVEIGVITRWNSRHQAGGKERYVYELSLEILQLEKESFRFRP